MILWWKVSSAPVAFFLKEQGKQCPHSLIASLRVTEKYTIIITTNTLNAVAHLQLEVCKSSQDLFKHPTNKNNHNYLQNHIKSLSTSNPSNDFLNIRYVVVTTYYLRFIAALKACAVACTVNAGFPSIVTQLWMRTKWESSQPWLSESIVTQRSVKPHAGGGCWRHKRRL